jgi:hypothetical protein
LAGLFNDLPYLRGGQGRHLSVGAGNDILASPDQRHRCGRGRDLKPAIPFDQLDLGSGLQTEPFADGLRAWWLLDPSVAEYSRQPR